MKRLAARAPDLDIFSSGYVLREPSGWQITEQGRNFLILIESPLTEQAVTPVPLSSPMIFNPPDVPTNVVRMVGYKVQRRRSAA